MRALLVVNTAAFYLSHRRPIGRALRAAGLDVTIAAAPSADAAREIEADGLRFEPLPLAPAGRSPSAEARTVAALVALYRRLRPDVVHHVTIKPVLYGSIAARALSIPVINAVSGLGYAFIPQPGAPLAHRALGRGVDLAYRAALAGERTRVIFQNPDDLARFVEGGHVPRARTRLVRGSGVDLSRFAPAPRPAGPPLVVLPARMLRDKGVVELVEAARVVKRARPEVRFALVGGNDSENPATLSTAELEAWVTEGVVEWWGHRRDMPEVLRQASLVALPSYREGLPLALAEAAACGRAVVTTDVPGCREVVRHGETGWLVPPRASGPLARAIEEALSDDAELDRRGAASRALAERELSVDAVVSQTLDVYRELLGGRLPR
ncbi:MAG: glycosyltransferase family 4 protein [Polyangiaceae bacterium]|nr:glycosyltransferase family 4 protein [Polyangiaceae bacterium]